MEPFIVRHPHPTGWIEVICGSMFSGKTEELIRRLKRAQFAKQRVEIFKPAIDRRFSRQEIVSHDENAIPSVPVDTAAQILLLVGNADVVAIDEAQFFGLDLVDVCQLLANDGKRVIVAGLDQDYLGQPFEPIPQLMAVAEHVTKLHAICVVCGAPANYSQRITHHNQRLLLGAGDVYEPRCRRCFEPSSDAASAPSDAEAPSTRPKTSTALAVSTPGTHPDTSPDA